MPGKDIDATFVHEDTDIKTFSTDGHGVGFAFNHGSKDRPVWRGLLIQDPRIAIKLSSHFRDIATELRLQGAEHGNGKG